MTLMARQYEKGVKAERERIIALLEAQITGVPGEEVTDEMWTLIHFGQDLIALIKGENK